MLPEPLPSIAALEAIYARRVVALGANTKRALLVAASSGGTVLGLLGLAPHRRDRTVADLQPAVDAGLITMQRSRLSWRHPLVRSAVYRSAPQPTGPRRTARLRTGCPRASPAGRHRAAAADGPDEQVATALDRIAADASRRAGFAAAARAAE